jgi:hypothetical protein
MKAHRVLVGLWVAVFCAAALLSGCGGGGGSTAADTTGSSGTGNAAAVQVNGAASKGPIGNAIVTVYALNADGTRGAALGGTLTDAHGAYALELASYSGDVLVEVTGGTYTDEATGQTRSNTTLRAVLTSVTGSVSVAVTPFTEVAYRLTQTGLSVEQANSYVSSLLGGLNIIATLPADATSAGSSGKTIDEINYGLALAAISQLIADGNATDVGDALSRIAADLADHRLDATGNALLTALTEFVASANNQSGIAGLDQTTLDGSITLFRDNIVAVPTVLDDRAKAKAFVSELADVSLSLYNGRDGGMHGIVDTPFRKASKDVTATVAPEIASDLQRLEAIMELVLTYPGRGTLLNLTDYPYSPYTTTATVSDDRASLTFTIKNGDIVTDSGTVTSTVRPGGNPSSRHRRHVQDRSRNVHGQCIILGTVDGRVDPPRTLVALTNGTITSSFFSFDFSGSGGRLSAAFPDVDSPSDIHPSAIDLTGRLTTAHGLFDGTFAVSDIAWDASAHRSNPATTTFNGSLHRVIDGSVSGVAYTGKVVGVLTNGAAYDGQAGESAANFPRWNAIFSGTVSAPSKAAITTFLKAAQSGYGAYQLNASYVRLNADNTVTSLTGSGSCDEATRSWSATISNERNLTATVAYDDTRATDAKLSCTIKASGGGALGRIYNDAAGNPTVEYTISGEVASVF